MLHVAPESHLKYAINNILNLILALLQYYMQCHLVIDYFWIISLFVRPHLTNIFDVHKFPVGC